MYALEMTSSPLAPQFSASAVTAKAISTPLPQIMRSLAFLRLASKTPRLRMTKVPLIAGPILSKACAPTASVGIMLWRFAEKKKPNIL